MIALVSLASPLSPRLTNALPHLLAQGAVGAEAQHRLDRRAGVADRVGARRQALASLAAAAAASFTSCWNARHVGLASPAVKVAFVGQQPRIEVGEGRRQLLVIVRQLGLLRIVELGAAADETFIGAGQQAHLLGIEAKAVALLVERLRSAAKSFALRLILSIGGRQLRRPFLVERLIFRRRHIVGHHAEDRLDTVEPFGRTSPSPRSYLRRSARAGLLAIASDLAQHLVDAELEGLRERARLHLVPRRNAIVGPGPFLSRILSGTTAVAAAAGAALGRLQAPASGGQGDRGRAAQAA